MKSRTLKKIAVAFPDFKKSALALSDEHLKDICRKVVRVLYDIFHDVEGVKVPSGSFDVDADKGDTRLWRPYAVWLARYGVELILEHGTRFKGVSMNKHLGWVRAVANDQSCKGAPPFATKEWHLECRRYLYSRSPETYARINRWKYETAPLMRIVSPKPPKPVRLAKNVDELVRMGWTIEVAYSKSSFVATIHGPKADGEPFQTMPSFSGRPSKNCVSAVRSAFREVIRRTLV